MSTKLVVVTGPPASGKSSLARAIAHECDIPFLSKDELKERLYEQLGSGPELEEAIEGSALAILFSVARSNIAAGVDVLVESNFDAETDLTLFDGIGAEIVQIHCDRDTDELVSSFAERAARGDRHPGHDDRPENAAEIRRRIEAGCWAPLDLPGTLIRVDLGSGTADPTAIARKLR